MSLPRSSKGFTLVELMIVVSIIALLAVVGVVVFSNIQRSSRDSRRRADIESIAKALEADKASKNADTYSQISIDMFSNGLVPVDPGSRSYCISPTSPSLTPGGIPSAWTNNSCNGLAGYAKVAVGTPTVGATGFRVCASLEDTSAAGTTNGVFCLSNQQ